MIGEKSESIARNCPDLILFSNFGAFSKIIALFSSKSTKPLPLLTKSANSNEAFLEIVQMYCDLLTISSPLVSVI
ncbi:hypothetical protein CP02DC21_1272, partial [Chlamydia psittaci 02DC21]